MKKCNPTTKAQSGGMVKPMPGKSGGTGSANNGLKKAWAEPKAGSTSMAAAKKRVK